MLKVQSFLAHIEAAATAGAGGIVGFFSTFLGQGVPSHGVQLQVAAAFAVFTWLVALWHRFKASPAQADLAKLAEDKRTAGAWSVDDVLRFVHDLSPLVQDLVKGPNDNPIAAPAGAPQSTKSGGPSVVDYVDALIADLTPNERAILEKRGVIPPSTPAAKGA